jgi:hypothetical protein
MTQAELTARYLEAKWAWEASEDCGIRPPGKTRQDMEDDLDKAGLALADFVAGGAPRWPSP